MGPREPKEGSSKPMRTIRNRKHAKMDQRSSKRKELANEVGTKANESQT